MYILLNFGTIIFLYSVLIRVSICQPNYGKCTPTTKMLDSSSKLPSGLISGDLVEEGAFDQCLLIDQKINGTHTKGKYCLIQIELPHNHFQLGCRRFLDFQTNLFQINQRRNHINEANCSSAKMKLILGWCLPDKCDVSNVSSIIAPIFNLSETQINPLVNNGFCQTLDEINTDLSIQEWSVIGFFIVILIIIILSTIYDIYITVFQKDVIHLILIAFSLKTNGQKLITISKNPNDISCLHGIRFLSMIWIILGHRYAVIIMEPIQNFTHFQKWAESFINVYLTYTYVSVDTFLLLSGLLIAYGFCLAQEKGEKFNLISYYIHRYIRLTPAFAVVILIHATILTRLGSGPLWPTIAPGFKALCDKYWWANLLYIQNYYNPPGTVCIFQSWYLATDMQLYILSPLILIPLWKWPKYTLYTSVLLILGSVASSFIISWEYDLTAFIMQADLNYNQKYYMATHARYGPWLIGIILGYYIFKLKRIDKEQRKLSVGYITVGWFICFGLFAVSLFGSYGLFMKHNNLGAAFFNGLHRHLWSIGVSWLIYACIQGYGGFINNFLSWSLFQILGRLTYSMYLIHLSLQFLRGATIRKPYYISDSIFVNEYFDDLCYSILLAICLTLSFELPVLAIEKAFKITNKK